jgi:NTP pyrophosphatase (non-canonical NTP hydrolase)
MDKYTIAAKMLAELERANEIHKPVFSSAHEGYAILLEEVEELWEEVRKKEPDLERMYEEAIQVGAMTIKFLTSLEGQK